MEVTKASPLSETTGVDERKPTSRNKGMRRPDDHEANGSGPLQFESIKYRDEKKSPAHPPPLPPPRGQLLPQPQRATPVYYLAAPSRTDPPYTHLFRWFSPLFTLRVVCITAAGGAHLAYSP